MFRFAKNLSPQKEEAQILVDIGAGSIGAAYARFAAGVSPEILYAKRLPIEPRASESPREAMARVLAAITEALLAEGAPALQRATGSGVASAMLVAIDAPWEHTTLHIEHIEKEKPFTFTESLALAAVEHAGGAPDDKLLVDESVVGTVLNGYLVNRPYGHKVKRASIVVLSSSIDRAAAKAIDDGLTRAYNREVRLSHISATSLRYQALMLLFPHERDVLILDADLAETSLLLVRRGLLEAVVEVARPAAEPLANSITAAFTQVAARFPLPRTILVLADEKMRDEAKQTLATPELCKLWLSANPPNVVPILPSHFTALVTSSAADADTPLLLAALFTARRSRLSTATGILGP